jgi:hypothetical protein
MIMGGMVPLITATTVLALPSVAPAHTSHCGNVPSREIYDIAGHHIGCSTAKAVAKAEMTALLTPGSGAKHDIEVDGKRWHYTWRNVNTSSTTQIEYYTARSGGLSRPSGTIGRSPKHSRADCD